MDALADQLVDAGDLTGDWLEVFTRVPRHRFIPPRIYDDRATPGTYRPLDTDVDPHGWWELAYADVPVVTQLDDGGEGGPGQPTSSASMPRMVTRMLAHLDVHSGKRVLEIGTGTGYNAALLAARLGDPNVVSVEIDPVVAAEARRNLGELGYHPRIVTGDGLDGYPPGAPFDRVIATAAVQHLPGAWVEQSRPGGVIVAPFDSGVHAGVLLRLTVTADGVAAGRVVGDAAFMWLRGDRPHQAMPDAGPGRKGISTLDPRELADSDVAFALGIRMPGVRIDGADTEEGYRVWLSADDGSWASAIAPPEDDNEPEPEVWQYGQRSLWNETEALVGDFVIAGRPARTRFGVTVHPRGRHEFWIDNPADTWT
ncbi:MAG: methyltransferase domain-containing protein [Sporichthyaceae bacterium]|nr:methyltransferase domain-containing protein [Sporichthyaceae bacterium]